jgi:hypothetical protein
MTDPRDAVREVAPNLDEAEVREVSALVVRAQADKRLVGRQFDL